MSETTTPEFARLSDYAYHWAEHHPEREALVLNQVRTSYGELARRVRALSKALLRAGVRKGDRVAMLVSSRPEFYVALLATVDIGAIWLGLHPRYMLPEFRHVLAEAQPKVLLAFGAIDGRTYHRELKALHDEFECIEHLVAYDEVFHGAQALSDFIDDGTEICDADLQAARESVEARDNAVIIFTSGSTGAPKGALLSHASLVGGGRMQESHWPSAAMRLLQTMPPNHIACIGMSTAHALVCGGTIVFMDQFDSGALLDVVENERITFLPHAPAMFNLMVNEEGFEQRDLSSIEYLIWAGAPMMQNLIKRLQSLDAHLGTAFGMTELGAYVSFSDRDASYDVLAQSIGRPEPGYDLRLADARGNLVEPGNDGEIQARGDWLMNGYFNHPDLTQAAFTPDGWFRTGDIAVQREDGNWTLVGRLKEMFKSGGYNVYPREVEIAIESHPSVAMAAVLGVSDELWHEVGYAFVQPAVGERLDVGAVEQWCRERLANYKVPKRFEFVEELPRLPIGKVDRQLLKRRLQE